MELIDHYGACTRCDAEAMFLFLCEDHGVEVDGYEHHFDRPALQDDRRRGGSYRRAGFELIRFSADQVARDAIEIAETRLSARRRLSS